MAKRNSEFNAEDLESEFDYESEIERKKQKRKDFLEKERPGEVKQPSRNQARSVFDEEHGKLDRKKRRYLALDAYSRHKEMINQYYLYYPGATKRIQRDTSKDKTDLDVIREHHKFIWSPEEADTSWEARLAKRYYDKLFKEYCIVDLSRYQENKFAMRWRTEKEVTDGKGQFICAAKKCAETQNLTSWEVNFAYLEGNEKKNALVKVRLCENCSAMLNYHHRKTKAVRKKRKSRRETETNEDAQTLQATSTELRREQEERKDISGNSAKDAETQREVAEADAKELWSKPIEVDDEKSREDEFEDFLYDLLL